MKKAILFPLIFAGSAAAIGAAGYYIYSTSTGEQNGTGVIINKSQTSPKKDLPDSVDETQKQHQNQQKSEEPEKNVEKDSSSLSDESQKPNQNQQKSPEPEKNLQNNNIQSIRVGFWNVLNYTNKSKNPNSAKTYALANVINSSGSDVVGLAEITSTGDGTDIIKELEKLNPSAGWKEITTNKYGKERQQEKYTFLYKSSLLETINFEGKFNPYLIQEGKNLTWARPVAAVKFKTKTNIKNDFTFAIGHFDAPGNKSKSRKEKADPEASGQGEQEANEARDLVNVLTEIDKKDGSNNEIIFMGDTNIRTENTDKLFKSTLESYRLLLNKDEKTSLSSKNFGEYANSYDKIFYKGDLKTKNAQKYNIFSIFEKNVVDLEKYDKMRKQDGRSINYKTTNSKDIDRIRGISDHTMVYFDLELSEFDKD
ncbi:endonuclease/exonuclease/phosphatase family protein [Mesomycoplasma ovipneumoniae]|uniref:endonuclease/exonuclease/phosphatase family protein n=1 Tax=Mesomycoplasma ovipneumoniae TaxID=29562 RepID=UPI00296458FD|nr:endonuclease/exonuclease/phosphatase family protein [Mesomycoplasma ovipneumoniae]MDW2927541.1 endonuclease/exonuclease/phosphatase family protein [Mesomycoplasma ovipneumoniae]MDW2933929.1 endonuclease/exonuclease/phosphatase family protein [Mesomycoplasma ovipneumoniae]